jgi:PAS domain S-box-containing protein
MATAAAHTSVAVDAKTVATAVVVDAQTGLSVDVDVAVAVDVGVDVEMPPTATLDRAPEASHRDHSAGRTLWEDLSLAHRLERALRESEAHFAAAFDCAPAATAVLSLLRGWPAQFVQVNEAMLRLTGYTAVELRGRHFADLIAVDSDLIEGELAGLQCSGQPQALMNRQVRWLHARGSGLVVNLRAAAMRAADGHVLLVCQFEDVTHTHTRATSPAA